jgi:hypothetical protein
LKKQFRSKLLSCFAVQLSETEISYRARLRLLWLANLSSFDDFLAFGFPVIPFTVKPSCCPFDIPDIFLDEVPFPFLYLNFSCDPLWLKKTVPE